MEMKMNRELCQLLTADILWNVVEDSWQKANTGYNKCFVVDGQLCQSQFVPELVPLYHSHCIAIFAYAMYLKRNPRDSVHYQKVVQLLKLGQQVNDHLQEVRGFPELPPRDQFFDVSFI